MAKAEAECPAEDPCSLLPDVPAAEVTREAILDVVMRENIIGPESDAPPLTFLKSLYWTVMTLLTVGYGDMSLPGGGSKIGYWILVVEIIALLVFVPTLLSKLGDTLKNQKPERTKTYTKSSEDTHIIVCGSVENDAMITFCKELFHDDHENKKGQAVIIQNHDPSTELQTKLNTHYSEVTTYLAGSILDWKKLESGCTHKAESCVLLTNKNSKNASEQDYRNILQALSIKRYVYYTVKSKRDSKNLKDDNLYNMKIVMQLIKPESKVLYCKSLNLPPDKDQLIIVEEIKMTLLAKSCFAPGLIALISNLIGSSDAESDDNAEPWMRDYVDGTGFEIYREKIDQEDYKSCMTFKTVARIAHQCFKAIVFALEIEPRNIEGAKTVIRLNPSSFELTNWEHFNYYLYIICSDGSEAKQVATLEMQEDKYDRLVGEPRTRAKVKDREQKLM